MSSRPLSAFILHLLRQALPLLLPLALVACSQGNSGDTATTGDGPIPTGINRFLVFPNPVVAAGAFETTATANAAAYYRAIDPNAQRDTLAKFKAINGFGTGGQEQFVVFRDVRDLGYGRRMTGRNNGGDLAFIVENYNVTALPGAYSSLNADAAVAADPKWHLGTNAIEYSASPCDPVADPAACDPNVRFAKFYNFDPVTGARNLIINLDGRGDKAMPGPCTSCHGGRGDPLTPADAGGQPRFPFVGNSASKKRGDTTGQLQPFHVDTFQFATTAGYTRADQEAKLKQLNQWVLCSYPLVGAPAGAEDACRPAATASGWQGTEAATMLKSWYGGPGMPNATYVDTYVPTGWQAGNVGATAENLYKQVVVPYCRTCHVLRGNGQQSDIDLTSKAKFDGYAERIKTHVFDRGNMPLAFIVYEAFWESSAPTTLARYLDGLGIPGLVATSGGAALRPGRPIADPGPSRMVRAGANATLSATNSLFATSYTWSVIASPGGGNATITSANSATASFLATTVGDYTVRLTVRNGSASDSKSIVITVDASFPDPASIRFASIKNILRNVAYTGGTCASCHVGGAATTTPVAYTDIDRDGVGGVTATDDAWFYKEVTGRVNLTEIVGSPLLRKPTGNHHGGGQPIVLTGGNPPGLSDFSKVYHWILNGMPTGGVSANAGTDSTNAVTFTGAPAIADIALTGALSAGATTYTWSIASGPGSATIVNANPATGVATLRVQAPGVYVVQLDITDGTSTDTDTRQITVQETAVAASFTPAGNIAVTFTGAPLAGPITLTNTSTGNPTTCLWEVLSGPAGQSLSSTSSCTTTTLTVPATAVGGTYQVRFTGSNTSTSSNVTNAINVLSAGSGVNANAGANSNNALTFSNSLVSSSPAGNPLATVALDGTASSGPGTLTYAWTVTGGPAGSSITNANASTATLNVRTTGVYTVQLVVDNGLPQGAGNTATRTITATANATFTQVKAAFASAGCQGGGCHDAAAGSPAVNAGLPPAWTEPPAGVHGRAFARVNTGSPTSSLLLLNPSCDSSAPNGNGHGGGCLGGFDHVGNDFSLYNLFLTWIVGGAPDN